MRIGLARTIIGGSVSLPSKMPGTGYGMPASACLTGAKLAKVPGSSCASCYALKGTYTRGNVMRAHARRLKAITDPLWVDAMVMVLNTMHSGPIKVDLGALGVSRQAKGLSRYLFNEPGWHRWHDSGDLQSVDHLYKICAVAERTPKIKHWLPTQELSMVREFLHAGGIIPSNLVIRVSSAMIDGHGRRAWLNTSIVFSGPDEPSASHICPAPKQKHHCGSCRACWSRDVPHVAYQQH